MKMKKILLTLGMLLVAITLTACEGRLDPFELLTLTHEVEADIESIMMDIEVDMRWATSDETFNIPMTIHVEQENHDRWKTVITTTILEEHEEITVFEREGQTYTEMLLEGRVVNRFRAESTESHDGDLFLTHFITPDTVDESSATSTDDDGYRLEFLLNLDGILAFLEAFNLAETISAPSALDEEDISGKMIIYLDELYQPTSIELNLEEIDLILDEEEVALTFEMVLTTVQIGDVTVDFPEWLDIDPINEVELIGVWTLEDESEYFLFFAEDQTGFLLDNTAGNMIFEDFTWEILNENHLHLHFEANMDEIDRQAIAIVGDTLTMLNLDNDVETTLHFSMTLLEFAEFLEALATPPILEADLVGVWTWHPDDDARDYLLVFDYDQTGFLFDNTAGNMIFEEFTWEILNGNHLYLHFEANEGEADRQEIFLDQDVLTLIGLDNQIEFSLYFTMTISEFIDFFEALEDADGSESTDEVDGTDLIGTWEWANNSVFQLIFNADGTGEWIGLYDEFTWETSGDELTIVVARVPQEWQFEIRGGNLILSSLDIPGLSYTYNRR